MNEAIATIPADVEDLLLQALPDKGKFMAKDLAAFLRELPRLLEDDEAGRYAVVSGGKVLATWDTYRDATHYARERCEEETFIVQKIDRLELSRWEQLLWERRQGGST
jgi:hypothetical protein